MTFKAVVKMLVCVCVSVWCEWVGSVGVGGSMGG